MKKIVEIFFRLHYGQFLPMVWMDILTYKLFCFIFRVDKKKRKAWNSSAGINDDSPLFMTSSIVLSRNLVDFFNMLLILMYFITIINYCAFMLHDKQTGQILCYASLAMDYILYEYCLMGRHDYRRDNYFNKFDKEYKTKNIKWKVKLALISFFTYVLFVAILVPWARYVFSLIHG